MAEDISSKFAANASGNLNNSIRVVGSGNTEITIGDNLVVLCQQIDDTAPTIDGQPVQIKGIGDQRPVAIVTANTQTAGTLTLTTWEKYGSESEGFQYWQQILKNSGDTTVQSWGDCTSIAALMSAQKSNPSKNFSVKMYYTNPNYSTSGVLNAAEAYLVKSFMNPVITNIDSRETVRNDTIVKTGTLTIMYTHVQWNADDPGLKTASLRA